MHKNPFSSISPPLLFEESKNILKNSPTPLLLLPSLTSTLLSQRKPFSLLIKIIESSISREKLSISSKTQASSVFEALPEYHKQIKKSNDPGLEANLLHFLSKFKFVQFPNIEQACQWPLNFCLEMMNIDSSLDSELIARTKVALAVFFNIFQHNTNRNSNLIPIVIEKCRLLLSFFKDHANPSSESFLKLYLGYLRVLHLVIDRLDDSKLIDAFLTLVFRSLFIGTLLQKLIFPQNKIAAMTVSEIMSSASELSDLEGSSKNDSRKDDLEIRIRNHSCLCLHTIIKTFPKQVFPIWNTLLRVPNNKASADMLDYIEAKGIRPPNINFAEPSLLYLLIFEKNAKVKVHLVNAISAILFNLPIKQWLMGLKIEVKQKSEGHQPLSQQLYISLRFIYIALLYVVILEKDVPLISHILKILAGLLNAGCFEKIKEEIHFLAMSRVLSKCFCEYENSKSFEEISILSNSIGCFSGIIANHSFSTSIYEVFIKKTSEKSLFNRIIAKSFVFIDQLKKGNSAVLAPILEGLSLMGKLRKNYNLAMIEYWEDYTFVLETMENCEKIELGVFKMVEELTKKEEEGDEEEESFKRTKEEAVEGEAEKKFYKFLKGKVLKMTGSSNNEVALLGISILGGLSEPIYLEFFDEEGEEIVRLIGKVAQDIANSKTLVCKVLGLFARVRIFNKRMIPEKILEILLDPSITSNNNAKIRNSWAIANWTEVLDFQGIEQIAKRLHAHIMTLCRDKKEKIAANGFRCLGLFYKNCHESLLHLFASTLNSKEIFGLILEGLSTASVKVCWNVCACIQNMMRSGREMVQKIVENQEIYSKTLELIRLTSNFKSQLHAVDTLTLFHDIDLINKGFVTTLETILEKNEKIEEENASFTEYRSVDELRLKLIAFLLHRISISLPSHEEYLISKLLIYQQANGILAILKQFVRILEKCFSFKAEPLFDEKSTTEKILQTKKEEPMNEELVVKGEEVIKNAKFNFVLMEKEKASSLKGNLGVLKAAAQKIGDIVDRNDKIVIGLNNYELIKELAEIQEGDEVNIRMDAW